MHRPLADGTPSAEARDVNLTRPMNRRHFLTASIATLVSSALSPSVWAQAKAAAPSKNPALRGKAGAAIEKALGFLEKAQKPGGFWTSQDYPGLTGLVVQALGSAPGTKHKNSKAVKDGLKFIRD